MSFYESLAALIIEGSYSLDDGQAMSVQELLERFGSEDHQERVLQDNDRARAGRLGRLTAAIQTHIAEHAARRIVCPLEESTFAPGSFLFRFADNDALPVDLRGLYARYRLLPAITAALHELTPREFELLCGELLALLECRGITVTQSQKDDGVDAVAELLVAPIRSADMVVTPFQRVAGGLSFLVYLQAKRYSARNKVGQEEVQELAGSWIAMRNAFFDGKLDGKKAAALRKADFRAADPVLLMLVTTSSFTSGARQKSIAVGIITMDGVQIGQLLLASDFGLTATGPTTYHVTVETLRSSLVTS